VTPVIEKELDKAAGKGKDQPRASVTLKPVTDQAKPAAKPAAGKPATAKPATAKPDAAAKATPKPAADAKAKPQKADAATKPKSVAN
jgi:D-alanyl-D-alanine carboxypeptidase